MTLSRWRRVVTGVAAGVIVLCAALIGASFSDETGGVSVASEVRPANIIPIEEDPDDTLVDDESTDSVDIDDGATNAVTVIDADDLPAADANSTDADDSTPDQSAGTDSANSSDDDADDATGNEASAAADTDTTAEPATSSTATPEQASAPLTATDDALGTGGGVGDAECALDRLVIYAGARVGGVAGSIRNALTQAGFGAGCATPITVLASNCPLQFAGALGAGSGYDPAKSFVASSATVDRDTMTAVMGTVGYAGNQIDILDFSFVNPDKPGEQWMAIFVPPSFDGWQDLAGRAGLSPSTQSLCAPSGELAG